MSKILIIDDEVQIRSLLARMLGLEGYEVCQAGDCKAAVKQLEVQSPDVVLCDVFLPDGNGVDLVLNIKKQSPNVEVILLTAHGNIPDGVQAIKNGAFDYITKGDDNNKIIPLISRAAEKARMNVRLEKLEKKAAKDFEGRLSVYRSEGFYLEMMPLGVDKAYGVAKLLERLGYRRSQMVCCGDGFNDLPMIEYAGFGVAMANAPEQLKEKADYVAPSCDEDGLVDVITRFIKDW